LKPVWLQSEKKNTNWLQCGKYCDMFFELATMSLQKLLKQETGYNGAFANVASLQTKKDILGQGCYKGKLATLFT